MSAAPTVLHPLKPRRVDFAADEWLAATRDLTATEIGVYWTICALIYARGGPIDDDAQWLRRNCGCDVRVLRRIRAKLLRLGKIERIEPPNPNSQRKLAGGKLTNRRCEQELNKARERMFRSRTASDLSVIRRRSQRDRGR
jgi:uncharacterized protein YdaU (DUF1376 family)